MATDLAAKPSPDADASAPEVRGHVHSTVNWLLVEGDYLWQAIWATVLGIAGLGALVVAIVSFDGLALALALVLVPCRLFFCSPLKPCVMRCVTGKLAMPNPAVNTDAPSAALRARRGSPVTLIR